MPRAPVRTEPVSVAEVREDLASGHGGGPLVKSFMLAKYQEMRVRGTHAELVKQASADIEMLREIGTKAEYWQFLADVANYHNLIIEDGKTAHLRPLDRYR